MSLSINNSINTTSSPVAAAAATSPSPPEAKVDKPKRPLSAYNLFYRFKRAKILEAYKNGDTSKETIVRITESTPGLEKIDPSSIMIMTPTQLNELSRAEIRASLLDNLVPKDTSQRAHRKSHGAMSFLEMNKIMVGSWKNINDTTRSVFEELAEEGRKMYTKRLAEFEEMYPHLAASASPASPKKKKARTSSGANTASPTTKKIKVKSSSSTTNPKKFTRVVSDVSSVSVDQPLFQPDGVVSSMSTMMPTAVYTPPSSSSYIAVSTPTANSKRSVFVTPDTNNKRRVSSSAVVPENIASSSYHFDHLDIDLTSDESICIDNGLDLSDIFDDVMEGKDQDTIIQNMCMDDTNHHAFPSLPLFSSSSYTPTASYMNNNNNNMFNQMKMKSQQQQQQQEQASSSYAEAQYLKDYNPDHDDDHHTTTHKSNNSNNKASVDDFMQLITTLDDNLCSNALAA